MVVAQERAASTRKHRPVTGQRQVDDHRVVGWSADTRQLNSEKDGADRHEDVAGNRHAAAGHQHERRRHQGGDAEKDHECR